MLDGFADFLLAAVLDGAGDFPDGGGGGLSLIDLAQQADDEVGVLVVLGEDEHFPLLALGRVEVFRDFPEDGAVEALGDDGAVEVAEVEVQLVGEGGAVFNLAGLGVEQDGGVALFVVDAVFAELGRDVDGGVVIDEVAVDDGFAVGVGEDGRAEDLRRVERGGRGEGDLHGVEVVDDAPVFAEVVALVAVEELVVGHVFVEDVAAVGFVDDDEVEVADGGGGAFLAVEDAAHEALHGRDLEARLARERRVVADALDVVDLREGLELGELDLAEGVLRLAAEDVAVDEEEDAAEAAGLEEAVDHREGEARLARAGGEGEEDGARAARDGALRRFDGADLVVSEGEARAVAQLVVGLGGEGFGGGFLVLAQEVFEAVRGHPAAQGVRDVHGVAQVLEPDAGFLLVLLEVGAAVRREDERDAVGGGLLAAVGRLRVGGEALREGRSGVAFRLAVEDARDVAVARLGLDDGDELQAAEEGVVRRAGGGRPFGDGEVPPLGGACAAAVAERPGVGLPADASELLVDEQARLGLALVAVLGGAARALLALGAREDLGAGGGARAGGDLLVVLRLGGALGLGLARLDDLGRDEVAVLVAVVAVRLVEPLGQCVGERQQDAGVLCGVVALVDGEVAFLAQGVEDAFDVARDVVLAREPPDAVHGVVRHGQLDAVGVVDEVDDGLADHAELHEARVGVGSKIALRLLAEAGEHREALAQECEIGLHDTFSPAVVNGGNRLENFRYISVIL